MEPGPEFMAKILVVDDEPLLRALLHTVVEAEDGPSGLRSAKALRPDCTLLDIMMPGLDGYDACPTGGDGGARYVGFPLILLLPTGSTADRSLRGPSPSSIASFMQRRALLGICGRVEGWTVVSRRLSSPARGGGADERGRRDIGCPADDPLRG